MAERLFVFVQMEFAWPLGPPDGRYLIRDGPDAEPEHVVVLRTLGAARVPPSVLGLPGGRLGRRRAARRTSPATPDAAPVTTSRATVVDPVPVSAEHQAQAWLEGLDQEREVSAATTVVNRVLQLHRLASADPYVNEVTPARALVIRAGWGEGERVADGDWVQARELFWRPPVTGGHVVGGRKRARAAALRPQERLAALLGGRTYTLLCEELALRARLDLDHHRLRHAAVQLDAALLAAVEELRQEGRQDLALRLAELEKLREGVAVEARGALRGEGEPDEELLAHALGRLESALRARTAPGFTLG